jgi:hypothetical protein
MKNYVIYYTIIKEGFSELGSRFRVQGSGFKVQGSRFRVHGSGFKERLGWEAGKPGGLDAKSPVGLARSWKVGRNAQGPGFKA